VAEAIDSFNDSQKLFFVKDIQKHFPNPKNTTLAFIGIAFKAETDDIRDAPSLALTTELSNLGYSIKAYDPQALSQYSKWLKDKRIANVELCQSAEDALQGTQAMLLLNEWQEFHRLTPERLKTLFTGSAVFDGKNL